MIFPMSNPGKSWCGDLGIVSNLARLSHAEMQLVVPPHILCASHCDPPPTASLLAYELNEFFLWCSKSTFGGII